LERTLGGDSPLALGGSEVTPLSFCLWDCIHHVGEERQGTWREEARFGGDEPHRYDHSEYSMYPNKGRHLTHTTAGGGAGMMEALACHPLGTEPIALGSNVTSDS